MSRLARWGAAGVAVGVAAGLASAAFLEALDWATRQRLHHGGLVYGLPLYGLFIGAVLHHFGHRTTGGARLVLDEIHLPQGWLPRRMAPMVFAGSVGSHLVGASVGREGAAVQLAAGLTDTAARHLHVPAPARRTLLVTAIAGGFGSVFGTPVAGALFALETLRLGRRHRLEALLPAFVASFVGDRVVAVVGVHHDALAPLHVHGSTRLLLALLGVGIAGGVLGSAFEHGTRALALARLRLPWPPLATAAGGGVVLLVAVAVSDRRSLGLSLPLLADSIAGGQGIEGWVFAEKLALTVLSVGTGFPGGEVTPVFVVGATLGVAVAAVCGAPAGVVAAVGLVTVFAASTGAPVAAVAIAAEVFGIGLLLPAAVGVAVATIVGGRLP
jgi:H+/Cl- antiporter ClcA